ncbi:class I SAM-dependent RNA methyltransferase [Acetobacteraceae bacterium ESL0709]|nr:class I SAM-dependent RNA methyltransferase [Acetobacteraceae bacterium ESL0697]MDF7678318.1 class I SAM-dependent RNA methyltransferase [Acetobacteraceae bacterium ESL0709]
MAHLSSWYAVEQLGSSGDGLVFINGQPLFIPGTLPGEEVRLSGRDHDLTLEEVRNISPDRVEPPCALSDQCGGCSLQHINLEKLLSWKQERVTQALHHAGFSNIPEAHCTQIEPYSRRRMDFVLQRKEGGVIVGLHQRGGDPVDMTECSLLDKRLFSLLPALRLCLSHIGALTGRGGLLINLLETGPDLVLETKAPLSATDKAKLADFARAQNIPRIAWRSSSLEEPETIVQWKPVFHHFGTVKVTPPPGAFMQATLQSEQILVNAVLNGLPSLNKKDVIEELYAGNGTFSYPLGEANRVQAYEGHKPAFEALKASSHGTKVAPFHRDLKRQPLIAADLKHARVVVLDPPFAGAGRQMEFLAQSNVQDVIYISCNPAMLAKDLKPLQQMGFEIVRYDLVDQFLWSADSETVLALSRDTKRIRKSRKR